MDLTRPFIGSAAVAAGLVTPKQLRGPAFRSPFRGVFVAADVEETYLLRCEAGALAVGALADLAADASPAPTALGGWAAAEALGAECAPRGVPVEVLVTGGHRRSQEGLQMRHGRALPGEIRTGVRIPVPGWRDRYVPGRTVTTTSPVRTAFDLARREDRIEAVIALDALSRVGRFAPGDVLELATRHPGERGVIRLPDFVALASPLAESPMETRIRLALHDYGVRPPVLQHPVGKYRIDLAYPDVLLGIEYDGDQHLDPERARNDLAKQAFLTRHGWEILRPPAEHVLGRREHLAQVVERFLFQRAAAGMAPLSA
ncbi:DUF559 domain-containing protein [Pseudonocardia sp. C8]|uniref:DUF559 domain-containing protein n=1 Tax=Pseudonocardia sp. C8 TaxID=2762759 RepID=UPI0016425D8D|nr:DUF559 domain-containing protein [Pseudonocardia sp. C8]MBC3193325.1 DUF559 domain-containing protein [Pseudonocardia sp. C8]